MSIQPVDSETWKHITYKELVSMPIAQRKLIARQIVASGALDRPMWLVEGWGRFESLPALDETQIQQQAAHIVASMSLEQKVRQMTPNTTVEQYIPACLKYNDFPYVAGEDAELGIPGTRFTDGPTGIVMGDASTCFPVSMARAATWDPELEQKVGEALGVEARSLGANLFGGVCVNLLRHPSWGRSQETYGEDPMLLGSMGSALVRGVQRHVMACVKHYALNSMENGRYKINVSIDERSLRELYLPHFKACVDAGVAAVMTAYNKVRGTYCGENPYLIRRILKGEWGFKGIVISDFIFGLYNGPDAAKAGLDIEMPIAGHYGENLVAGVRSGLVSEEIIDESAQRILATKLRFSKVTSDKRYTVDQVACPEHRALAYEVALKSAVLLKNEGPILPLNRSAITQLMVLGPLADKANIGEMKGSSHVYPPYVITPLAGLRQKLGSGSTVTYSEHIQDSQTEIAVSQSDAVIVVVGLTSDDEGEYIPHWDSGCGGDRAQLQLNPADLRLVAATSALNPRTIVVLQGGGALITHPWDAQVASILMTWYPGMEGGRALADILFGDFNPSGRLPLTIPQSMDQLPPFDKDEREVTYGYFHGYFLTDRESSSVSYPFGFGLSYTTFNYSNMRIIEHVLSSASELQVEVDVANTGSRDGMEVVQLYVGCVVSRVLRHKKELRAFEKIALKAGESRRVVLSVPVSQLAFWDVALGGWNVERTSYLAYIGSSSLDRDLLVDTFEIGE